MSDTLLLNETDTTNMLGKPHKVILFNDDDHSMEAVAAQIIKAINCDETRALTLMLEAHKTGRAVVFTGGLERCELVESILAEIKLRTKIEEA